MHLLVFGLYPRTFFGFVLCCLLASHSGAHASTPASTASAAQPAEDIGIVTDAPSAADDAERADNADDGENIDPTGNGEDIDEADNTQAALYYALLPRRQQTQALAILFPDASEWTAQDAWLSAVADHATKGSATWTERRCEQTLDGARRAFTTEQGDRTQHRRTQLTGAILLDAAAHCSQEEYIELALRATSYGLVQMRTTVTLPKFRDALVYLASAGTVERLRRTDTRLLLPYVDALLHLRDYAALERLTTLKLSASPDVGKSRLEAAHARAQGASSYTLPVDAPKDCRPMLNGTRVRSKSIDIRQGTHLVGCEGKQARLRYYDAQSTALFD